MIYLILILFSLLLIVIYDFKFRFKNRYYAHEIMNSQKGTVFLTYDDGPSNPKLTWGDDKLTQEQKEIISNLAPEYDFELTPTENITSLLETHNKTAMFFIQGKALENEQGLKQLKRVIKNNSVVANHGYNHLDSTNNDTNIALKDFLDTHLKVREKLNIDMQFFRPPKGLWSDELTQKIKYFETINHYKIPVNWNFDTRDWETKIDNKIESFIDKKIKGLVIQAKKNNGTIVLLHDVWASSYLFTKAILSLKELQVLPASDLSKSIEEANSLYLESKFRFYIKQRFQKLKLF